MKDFKPVLTAVAPLLLVGGAPSIKAGAVYWVPNALLPPMFSPSVVLNVRLVIPFALVALLAAAYLRLPEWLFPYKGKWLRYWLTTMFGVALLAGCTVLVMTGFWIATWWDMMLLLIGPALLALSYADADPGAGARLRQWAGGFFGVYGIASTILMSRWIAGLVRL